MYIFGFDIRSGFQQNADRFDAFFKSSEKQRSPFVDVQFVYIRSLAKKFAYDVRI